MGIAGRMTTSTLNHLSFVSLIYYINR